VTNGDSHDHDGGDGSLIPSAGVNWDNVEVLSAMAAGGINWTAAPGYDAGKAWTAITEYPGANWQSFPAGEVSGVTHTWRIPIVDPNTVVTASTVIPIGYTEAALTITRVRASTDNASYELSGDVKYADALIGLANATVVNDFDTTSGVRDDSTITSASIASGKFVYLSFDSAPDANIGDCVIHITWDYD